MVALFSNNSTYQGESTTFDFIAKECLSWLKEVAMHPLDVTNIRLIYVFRQTDMVSYTVIVHTRYSSELTCEPHPNK